MGWKLYCPSFVSIVRMSPSFTPSNPSLLVNTPPARVVILVISEVLISLPSRVMVLNSVNPLPLLASINGSLKYSTFCER